MNEIAKVKKEVKVSQWAEMVRQRNESGLTVTDWCKENGINLKTYYYRLKRVRQAVCNEIEQHDIISVEPIAETETTAEKKTDSCCCTKGLKTESTNGQGIQMKQNR